jgi:hypothetical protein
MIVGYDTEDVVALENEEQETPVRVSFYALDKVASIKKKGLTPFDKNMVDTICVRDGLLAAGGYAGLSFQFRTVVEQPSHPKRTEL